MRAAVRFQRRRSGSLKLREPITAEPPAVAGGPPGLWIPTSDTSPLEVWEELNPRLLGLNNKWAIVALRTWIRPATSQTSLMATYGRQFLQKWVLGRTRRIGCEDRT